jgi:hypothetical protein
MKQYLGELEVDEDNILNYMKSEDVGWNRQVPDRGGGEFCVCGDEHLNSIKCEEFSGLSELVQKDSAI